MFIKAVLIIVFAIPILTLTILGVCIAIQMQKDDKLIVEAEVKKLQLDDPHTSLTRWEEREIVARALKYDREKDKRRTHICLR